MLEAHVLKRCLYLADVLCSLAVFVLPTSCSHSKAPGEPSPHPWRLDDPAISALNEGVAWMEQYEYAKAVESFERALAYSPGLREARINLAVALFNRAAKEDILRSAEILDALIRQDPRDIRSSYLRAMIHRYSGEDSDAIRLLERVVELDPGDAYAWYFLGTSKANLQEDPRRELRRAVEANPNLVSAYFALLRAATLQGREEEAAELRKKFAELREHPAAETVVSPEYRRIGPLALARPLEAGAAKTVSSSEVVCGQAIVLWEDTPKGTVRPFVLEDIPAELSWRPEACFALADVNADGFLDVATNAVQRGDTGGVCLFLRQTDGRLEDVTEKSGIQAGAPVLSIAFGDFDNDGKVDLFLGCAGPNRLYRGRGDGTFEDVSVAAGVGVSDAITAAAIFLDADHDSDLDILVSNLCTRTGSEARNELLNNNGDGTFSDIAPRGPIASSSSWSAVPFWADGDRDLDLVVFDRGPARVLLNDLGGLYREGQISDSSLIEGRGGVAQDFDGDGHSDLLIFGAPGSPPALYVSRGGTLRRSSQADSAFEALGTWGEISSARCADLDLDGDLDIVFRSVGWHALLNDGAGRFLLRPNVFPRVARDLVAWELVDWNEDGTSDLLRAVEGEPGRIELLPVRLEPPQQWIAIQPSGDRGADKRTRSPASGYGTRIEVRVGVHSQTISYFGIQGAGAQSQVPAVFGLDGASRVDYVALLWPDGVTQSETGLAPAKGHRIHELERRMSSCPVLFAWNGEKFEFVSDFAGVGGLGYYLGPNKYAEPQVLEHVRIAPEQLRARDGRYELRIVEAMEEVVYLDRVELVAVDHPTGLEVYPDERLSVGGAPPTRRLLCIARPIFPLRAFDFCGSECTDRILKADFRCAYPPPIDRRFPGFAARHSLTLDFGDRLEGLRGEEGVYLFLEAWIEYPYSQTVYAARQASVTWEPIRVETRSGGGSWQTAVADAGLPGGLGRTIGIDLSGKIPRAPLELRVTTNLEVYVDRAFVAKDIGADSLRVRAVPLEAAVLRRLGFPREFHPGGDVPPVYSYDAIEPHSDFRLPSGAYTRYGPVEELLREFDDRYAIFGSGDEIALTFDAAALGPLTAGETRSFLFVSHAWCKDMDLYTAAPDTVEPLPFRGMSRYPYPPWERHPEAETGRYRAEYNTRQVGARGEANGASCGDR